MDTPLPLDPGRPGSASASAVEPDLCAAVDVLLVLLSARDVDALERQLLACAVHPEGLGGAEAYLLLRHPRLAHLEAMRAVKAHSRPGTLIEALRDGASVVAVAPDELDGLMIEDPELEPPLARAWAQGAVAFGPAEDARRPWRAGELGVIPLRAGLRPYGLLVVNWAAGERTPARERTALALQRTAAIASDTLGRIAEQRRRGRQAEALRELAHAAASSLNLAEALRLGVRLATHATGATGGALWLRGADGRLRLEATHGPAAEREAIARALTPLAEAGVPEARPRAFESPSLEALLPPGATSGIETLTLAPLVAYGRDRGVLAVYDGHAGRPGEPTPGDVAAIEFLTAAADLVALVAEQAERWDALRAGEQQREELRARARRQERLAMLGERVARSAHEARHPLASIVAFARRVHRGLAEQDPNREHLEIVVREAARLERLLGEQLELGAPAPESLRVESVNAAIQEVLQQASETLVRRRIRLLKRLAPDLEPLLLDPALIRRVLRSILEHALESVSHGGRIRVESRRVQQHVVVDVANDGPRRAGEMLEQLFVPFHDRVAPGNEPALGVARRIVHEQGGEIRLRSEGEWSTIVSFTLPIAGNQDRRALSRQRRTGRGDRRAVPFES